ncbi:MAG: hypothetical protein MUP44_05045 [Anaerolineales bacterium]|nr:hypothetical protein [Anaerolineales bacterium]
MTGTDTGCPDRRMTTHASGEKSEISSRHIPQGETISPNPFTATMVSIEVSPAVAAAPIAIA